MVHRPLYNSPVSSTVRGAVYFLVLIGHALHGCERYSHKRDVGYFLFYGIMTRFILEYKVLTFRLLDLLSYLA